MHSRFPSLFRVARIALATFVASSLVPRETVAADGDSPPVLSVPPGFSVQRVAGDPLVQRPMFATLDRSGALYVLDSGGANGNDRREKPSDVIRRLTDADDDGIYDRSVVVADRIVFGTGLAWRDDALFVASPPSLWKFEDADRDGTFETRVELATGFAFNQSCTDDLHGAVAGPDGRIYFLPGRFKHRVQGRGSDVLREAYGPWLMRCRPDGSDLEFVSGAVGNPVEVAFLPSGDAFVQGTFWAKPSAGDGLRDATIHAIPGGEYSVRDRDYTDRVRTGDFLPALTPLGATAPSGLTTYLGDAWGDEFRGDLFTSHFNTGKILRHRLSPRGATYAARVEDFVTASHRDVHFTDVLQDADGSLLVVDTGGWFHACCPASGSSKPNVLGAIHRVTRDGVKRPADPYGLSLSWHAAPLDALVARLRDPRFFVRERAIDALAKRGDDALDTLARVLRADDSSPDARLAATWAACRIDGLRAREVGRIALADASPEVRQAAASAAALHRDAGAFDELVASLADPAPRVRREAAHALGRLGDVRAVGPLLDAMARLDEPAAVTAPGQGALSPEDRPVATRFAEHALVFALVEIGDPAATRKGLASDDPDVRRAALVALDQMPRGDLRPDEVARALAATNEKLRTAAVDVLQRRPDWSRESIRLCDDWLSERPFDDSKAAAIAGIVRTRRDDDELRGLVARRLNEPASLAPAARRALLVALAGSDVREIPAEWRDGIALAFDAPDADVRRAALDAVEGLRLATLADRVRRTANDSSAEASLRIAATRTLAGLSREITPEEFDFLLARSAGDAPIQERLAALDVLGSLRHDEARLERLLPRVAEASPIELPRVLAAFAGGASPALGRRLVETLSASKVGPAPELVERTLEAYEPDVKAAARPLLERLTRSLESQVARLDEIERALDAAPGDSSRGGTLFFAKAQCHLCHAVRGRGGRVGPDLSTIGDIRSRRGLAEAVLFPSASFARGYEPVTATLVDGRVLTGLAGRETADEVVLITLRDDKPSETPLRRDEIEELRLGRVSTMPQGLDATLSRDELADLIAYLQSLRAEGTPAAAER